MTPRCETCLYMAWNNLIPSRECRINPPPHPEVYNHHWCGQWIDRTTRQPLMAALALEDNESTPIET